jgi:hypothetical protein
MRNERNAWMLDAIAFAVTAALFLYLLFAIKP